MFASPMISFDANKSKSYIANFNLGKGHGIAF